MRINMGQGFVKNQKMAEVPNNRLMRDRSVGLFVVGVPQKFQLHCGAIGGRYERGSRINKTSHVPNLRHVVESLSVLK